VKIEISANRRFEAVRVMLGIEKRQMCIILKTTWYSYNEMAMGRKTVPLDWLIVLRDLYGLNIDWVINENGNVLC
jgi:hypothetical protein